MSYNSEDLTIKQNTPIAALLGCQATAKSRSAWCGARFAETCGRWLNLNAAQRRLIDLRAGFRRPRQPPARSAVLRLVPSPKTGHSLRRLVAPSDRAGLGCGVCREGRQASSIQNRTASDTKGPR